MPTRTHTHGTHTHKPARVQKPMLITTPMSPPQALALATEQIIGLFTQAVLYGFYVATLILCLRWLVYTDGGWKQRDRVNKLMLITTILLFICLTVDLVLSLPDQLYLMGDFGGSNLKLLTLFIIEVCK